MAKIEEKSEAPMDEIMAWQQRFEQLRQELSSIGYLLQGTITERIIEKTVSTGSLRMTRLRGPYYQWTWKKKDGKGAKTVTVNLSAQQRDVFQQAIDNNQRIMDILQEMRDLSVRILDATTPGVKRRKYSSIIEFKKE